MAAPIAEDRSTETAPASSNGRPAGETPRSDDLSKSSQFRATLLADRTRHRRRRLVAVVVVVVIIAAAGGTVLVARSASASPTAQYRTATAAVHDVDQQLTNVATIEPVTQAAVAFPTSGTVATVDVTVGATVIAGQTLATLDTRQLEVTLHDKQSSLANAQLALQTTLNTAASQATSTTTTQRVTTTTAASSGTQSSAGVGAAPTASSGSNASVPQSSGTGSAPQSSGNGSSAPTGGADPTAAQSSGTGSTPTGSSGSNASASQSSGSGSPTASPATGGSSKTVSSADEYAAQQAVSAAQAEVTAAEQAIAQATVVSPINGTVQAINLEPGDSVSSSSTTATILIVGDGGVEAATTVNVDNISKVKIGQPALVRPDGTAQPIEGEVVAISTTPISTSGTATYRVIIGLHGDTSSLGNGSTATASITTNSTKAALAVPTSAITSDGDRHTVTVLDGTTTKQVDVQIGAIGQTWTAITNGLTDGQTVVLADLTTPLPSAATTATNQNTNRNPIGNGGGGLPPGAGFPTGGFPGGGAAGGPR